LTAGFIAAEAREREQSPATILGRLGDRFDPLDITWSVVSLENGSLNVKAVVRRTGGWLSKHKSATVWVLGGAVLLAPHVGLPALAAHALGVHVAGWGAQGAVHAATAAHDHSVQRSKSRGGKAEAAPPQITAEVQPAELEPPPPEPAYPERTYIYIDGMNQPKTLFVRQLRAMEGVDQQSRPIDDGGVIKVWSRTPLDEAVVRSAADASGVIFIRMERETD
jgi:hypothetical protein